MLTDKVVVSEETSINPLLNHKDDDLLRIEKRNEIPKRILNKRRISVTLPKNPACFSYNVNEIPLKGSTPFRSTCNNNRCYDSRTVSEEDESRQDLTAMSVLSLYQNCDSDNDMDTSK